nr:HD domain-containing phosphohydrolase [Clostridium estertheticum]
MEENKMSQLSKIEELRKEEVQHERTIEEAIFYSGPDMHYIYDQQGRLVRWNEKFEDITGYSSKELAKMSLLDWYKGDEKSYRAIMDCITRAIDDGFGVTDAEMRKNDGTIVSVYFKAFTLCLNGKKYIECRIIDITQSKRKEKEICYLSYHDQLTGLYNRRFYEEELTRLDTERNLPMTIVMGDVNGLKFINDSFGHIMGDRLLKKVAKIISLGCRADDIIARLGGDEFVIILPRTDAFVAEKIIKRIKNLSLGEKVGFIDISVSFGYQTKNSKEEKTEEILITAENNMYNNKLFEGPIMKVKTIKSIINTLYEENKEEEKHSHEVSKLCGKMGEALDFSKYEVNELKEVGLLHNIGKIAIHENLPNKTGKLTSDEWKKIKSHCEIGYRMLNTVNGMSNMAIYILYHHERWDGLGYPKGLKGAEIPIASRIINIADAYDSMSRDRCYRSALSMENIIKELQKNAGHQFDPELVTVFIKKILGK